MKKTIFVFAAIFSFAILFTSCKETKKEEAKEDVKIESHEGHDHDSKEMSSTDVYQCPMDCEKGKTYDKAGSCPVCKMDLKVKSVDNKDLKNTVVCNCKKGGECTCAPGECKCGDKVASNKKACAKCAPGECKRGSEVAIKKMECTKCAPGECKCKA
ncbi:MAG: heavy metal-binding domain-containing protein [Lutibacter sp.]|uniref:heavy metal-binding domain-containing protein n=1 Tax=Lutibacter sp. TaxID=1925666 RepID=UPI003858E8A8